MSTTGTSTGGLDFAPVQRFAKWVGMLPYKLSPKGGLRARRSCGVCEENSIPLPVDPLVPLELHPCRPEDVLAGEVAVPGGGIVEEGGVPPLPNLHGEADTRVEIISDPRGTRVAESRACSPEITRDVVGVLQELVLPRERQLRHHYDTRSRHPVVGRVCADTG